MNRGAFGAVSYDFSDPTVQGAKHKTSIADEYSASAAKSYLKSAFAGVMIPLDPKILQIQADMIQKGYIADQDVLAKVQADDPGGDWDDSETMMSDWYSSDPNQAGYTTQPEMGQADKYRNYIIAGSVLVGGLALIWYLRK
jgi:hypothetical protein